MSDWNDLIMAVNESEEKTRQNTACEHGHQRRKCPICELIACEKERDELKKDKEHLLAVCEERRLVEAEWKRRAIHLWHWLGLLEVEIYGGIPEMGFDIQKEYLEVFPEAKLWFDANKVR